MPEFSVRADRIEQIADRIWDQRKELDRLAGEIHSVARKLEPLSGMEETLRRLKRRTATLEQQAQAMDRMTRTLDTVTACYRRAEEQNLRRDPGVLPPQNGGGGTLGQNLPEWAKEAFAPWQELIWWTSPPTLPQLVLPAMLAEEILGRFRKNTGKEP
ncbi:hypothetical protein [uncultured Gemmiger sp.]|uniref:hypothetical protein n=1 Tax=uncultured Gemmiger sp. TaxID=1623490 RepID=UPI0025E1FE2F|nr:hypothetical protein [uncultured Gemmiger sp.]